MMSEAELRKWILRNVRVAADLTRDCSDYNHGVVDGVEAVVEVYNADGKRWERYHQRLQKVVYLNPKNCRWESAGE